MTYRIAFASPTRAVEGQSAVIDSRARAEGIVRRLKLTGWLATIVPTEPEEPTDG